MQIIIAKDNQYLKMARAVREKKGRAAYGCFLAEGLRLVEEALAQGVEPLYALFSESALADPRMQALAQRLEAAGTPAARISDSLFATISATGHPQGVALLAPIPQPLPPRLLPEQPCFVYADDIRDPGNLGALIRTAHAANAGGLWLSPESADIYNPKVLRAAMGACFKLPLYRAESGPQALSLCRELGLAVYVAAAQGQDIREAKLALDQPHIWVLGSEADGAAPLWLAGADQVLRLPMRPDAESLNVATAGAILLYHSYFSSPGK